MARSLKKGPYVEEALQSKIEKMNANSEKKVVNRKEKFRLMKLIFVILLLSVALQLIILWKKFILPLLSK